MLIATRKLEKSGVNSLLINERNMLKLQKRERKMSISPLQRIKAQLKNCFKYFKRM